MLDPEGNNVTVQIVPISDQVQKIPGYLLTQHAALIFEVFLSKEICCSFQGRNSSASHELVFVALQVPPVGYKSFHVTAKPSLLNIQKSKVRKMKTNGKPIRLGDDLSVSVHPDRLVMKTSRKSTPNINYSVGFKWYEGFKGKENKNQTLQIL